MSTTDTILASLTEQVRQLQAAIDWLDDHREHIDKCEMATVQPFHAYVYLHAGKQPKALAKTLSSRWKRDTSSRTVCWWDLDQKFPVMKLCLWDTEEHQETKKDEVEL